MLIRNSLIALCVIAGGGLWAAPARAGDRGGFSIVLDHGHLSVHAGFSWHHGRRFHRDRDRRFVRGHYETRCREVPIPGYYRNVWVPPVYRTLCDRWGRTYSVLVRPGYSYRVWVPPHLEERQVRMWIPGHWIDCR